MSKTLMIFIKSKYGEIDNGTIEYIGQGTLKKGQPAVNIYRGKGVTIVTKTDGEFVTIIESGTGLDLAIQMLD